MQAELRALITRHCATLVDELTAVRTCLAGLDRPDVSDAAVLADGIEHAHRIKGSSGSIGFGEISAAAAALEMCLRGCAGTAAPVGTNDRAQILSHYDRLAELVDTVTPEQSSLFNAEFPAMNG